MNLRKPSVALLLSAALASCGVAPDKRPPQQPRHILRPSSDRGLQTYYDRLRMLDAARHSSVPAPLVVLRERTSWNHLGSDSPTFVLYADGTVIYRAGEIYRSTKLDRDAKAALLNALLLDALSHQSGRYETTSDTDQATADLLFYGVPKPFSISIYGDAKAPAVRAQLSDEIIAAYDLLRGFARPGATPWLPAQIEVLLMSYDNAIEPSIAWPKEWPGLGSMKRKQHYSMDAGSGPPLWIDEGSIYLPAKDLGRLQALLATEREKGAVLIGGRKWSVSPRLPFPREELWQ
ncbi:MAG: putative lipoprotein [Sphingomonas bacterium]|uniref:hypothetical protein n=1 Tax=Sphingomonas bacterium TaxID=1895847 RepID=UPI00262E9275|nr:hypothetical protein [Sphingomonas bacterium]MDB5709381.1 putative lipoprotein [Sphingomonas bacterium]